MLTSIVHYTLHALFKGHFLFSNNVDKNHDIYCLYQVQIKIQIGSKTNPCDKGYFSIWSGEILRLTSTNTVAKYISF